MPWLRNHEFPGRIAPIVAVAVAAVLLALGSRAAPSASAPATTQPAAVAVDVDVLDRRSEEPVAVREAASAASRDGVVLVWFGSDPDAIAILRAAALESAAEGYAVKSVMLGRSDAGDSVAVYGGDGSPQGAAITRATDMKLQIKTRVREVAGKMKGAGSATNGMSLPTAKSERKCRVSNVTGSRVRRERLCFNEQQQEGMAKKDQDWVKGLQDKGGNGPLPASAGGG